MSRVLSRIAPRSSLLSSAEARELIRQACPAKEFRGKRVLLLIPDATRSCPLGMVFSALHEQIAAVTAAFDVMIALGTHPPMSEEAICTRLEITMAARASTFAGVRFFNHEWDSPAALREVGVLSVEDTRRLTGGLLPMAVSVTVNRRLFDYDVIIIAGPVFPHEVVGFSGGNKYLFPGVSGPEVLNFFHWLGAVVTNPMIIGHKVTPVRRIVDRAAAMVPIPKVSLCMVVQSGGLAGLFIGEPEAAWDAASELSKSLHITRKKRPFHTVLSCAPRMYDDLWVGGKCMYKLEPVVADEGELIIYAPHINEVSHTHGALIREIGYHCRDYFLGQWERFRDYPWGILAHSTHVRGIGTYQDGVEKCRVRVTLATGIPPEICVRINLGYRDPATIDPAAYAGREEEGVLLVPHAGEELFHLEDRPAWARGGTEAPF